jgi:ubiquinone/menaquinone biosynthesis C-methylase UbiE
VNPAGGRGERRLPRSPFPAWASFLLKFPLRYILVNRRETFRTTGIEPGQTVLELGAGSGFWTGVLSDLLGPTGRLYAQDIQLAMLAKMRRTVRSRPFRANIVPLLASSSELPLADASVDVVFAAWVFEEIETEGLVEPTARELARVLRDGGRMGFREHRIGVSVPRLTRVFDALEQAGFERTWTDTSRFTYMAQFRRSPRTTA